jgi:large subunit ribosomal protein L24
MKIKKGDKVIVTAGKDKGVQGEVLQTAPKVRKILVEGVNLVKKHIKAQESKKGGKVGQRIELPTFINVSNAKIVCPVCGKPTRVGYEVTDKGKFRICKKCGKKIEEKAN